MFNSQTIQFHSEFCGDSFSCSAFFPFPLPTNGLYSPTMTEMYNTPWRKLATAIYTAPTDGRIYGTMEFDVTDAQKYIQQQREAGVRITMTHLVTAALGRVLAYDVPEMNCFVRRGKIIPRHTVDVTVSVIMKRGQEMSAVKVQDAHLKPVSVIGEEINRKAMEHRSGDESKAMQNKDLLGKIPWPFRRWAFRIIRWIVNDLGFQLKFLGLSDNSFGSIMLSNIGTHGLTTGMAALFPAGKLPAVMVMGHAEEKPVVRNGEIVIRTMLPLTGTFDHRIVDGGHTGKLARGIMRRMSRPSALEQVLEETHVTG
ncbi:MAG: dehydrogenase [Candidatus Marinimicrobia bacterium CG_4_9_14_3_um_filter_48_9]|nr:MAG: dehydrogenase [Candidatus Marinimicrobia bacterium CG_4_9_14_3_um_filter_48_9]